MLRARVYISSLQLSGGSVRPRLGATVASVSLSVVKSAIHPEPPRRHTCKLSLRCPLGRASLGQPDSSSEHGPAGSTAPWSRDWGRDDLQVQAVVAGSPGPGLSVSVPAGVSGCWTRRLPFQWQCVPVPVVSGRASWIRRRVRKLNLKVLLVVQAELRVDHTSTSTCDFKLKFKL